MRNLARARKARGRPWQELAPGYTTERIGTFQVSGGRSKGGLTLLLKSSNRGCGVRWFLLGTTSNTRLDTR